MITTILCVPLLAGLFSLVIRAKRAVEFGHCVFNFILLAIGIVFCAEIFKTGPREFYDGLFYVDALGAFFLSVILVVNALVAVYTVGYVRNDIKEGHLAESKFRKYYLLLNLFIFTMVLVCVAGNLGVLWIAVEATTLASAFLVGIYNKDVSIEAAWKYIIICTVGITCALFGTVLLYYASVGAIGDPRKSLNWIEIARNAGKLDPRVVKIAFIFVLVGYGTKAGLAPMHTWMPDAHSQAPSPVSALLSGVLLKCALYGMLRYHIIVKNCAGEAFSGNLFLFFGIISLLFAMFFILIQSDIKRLFAYSSLEHIGIISAGIGFGGALGVFGALLHVVNHAMTKSLMFFAGGNIVAKYRSRGILRITGISSVMPLTGAALLIGGFALAGSPPFSVFLSELTILKAGFSSGKILSTAVFLLSIVIIFIGIIRHVTGMAFKEVPADVEKGEVNRWSVPVMVFLIAVIFVTGLYIPRFLAGIIDQCVGIINGNV